MVLANFTTFSTQHIIVVVILYNFVFPFSGNRDGDRKDNAWFGVSVVSSGYNGYVLVSKPIIAIQYFSRANFFCFMR